MNYSDILKFWFDDIEPKQRWRKDDDFDRQIVDRFTDIHNRASKCELFSWRSAPAGRLAEIIVLDQFSRNMFRNSPRAFAQDPLALALAQEAVSLGVDRLLRNHERHFIYLPFMHSESLLIHETAVRLYSQEGMESGLEWELKHKTIIERFSRYPHRNKALGRPSTAEEIAFLKNPGSSF